MIGNLSGVREPGVLKRLKLSAVLLLLAVLPISVVQTEDRKKEQEPTGKKRMCITFDELPFAESFEDTVPEDVLGPILQVLKEHEIKAAGFVVGKRIDNSYDLLGEWLNEGHVLGNLTYSHADLHEIGIEQFLKDIAAGKEAIETMLSGFGQERRYFRYPFLHYGTTVDTKRLVRAYLEDNNFLTAHVSVVVEDYLYDLTLQKLGHSPDSGSVNQLLDEYVRHVHEQLRLAELLSRKLFSRNCIHILQLRANRLNSLALPRLLEEFKELGYSFVRLDTALRDKAYAAPEAYYGSRGISYLEMIDRSDPDHLPAQ